MGLETFFMVRLFTVMSVMLPPSLHSTLIPSRHTFFMVQLLITTSLMSPMDFRPMRMAAHREEKEQPVI